MPAFTLGMRRIPIAMIGATLTSRLAQEDRQEDDHAFTLASCLHLKPLWAWLVDGVRLPLLGGWGSAWRGWYRRHPGGRRGHQSRLRGSPHRSAATIVAAVLVGVARPTSTSSSTRSHRDAQALPARVGSGMAQMAIASARRRASLALSCGAVRLGDRLLGGRDVRAAGDPDRTGARANRRATASHRPRGAAESLHRCRTVC